MQEAVNQETKQEMFELIDGLVQSLSRILSQTSTKLMLKSSAGSASSALSKQMESSHLYDDGQKKSSSNLTSEVTTQPFVG